MRLAVRCWLAGQTPAGAARLVSLHDADARPIRKGRIDKPVEFRYKAHVADNDDGIILDCSVEYGPVPDAPQLAPAVHRIHRRAQRVLLGFPSYRGDIALKEHGDGRDTQEVRH